MFWPRQARRDLALYGLPNFYSLRADVLSFSRWTHVYDTRPLLPTFNQRARHLMLLLYQGLLSRRERRYYHAVFDLNGAGWRAVRAEAEKSRSKAESVLNRDALLHWLPPPAQDIRTGATDFFQVGSRKKSLLAFMLWASEHL